MSDEIDWDFSGPDDAKAEIRAAVGYCSKMPRAATAVIIAIVNEAARGLSLGGGQDPLDDGMPGG